MAQTVWDRRLMSPARAMELGGNWPLRVVLVDEGAHLRTVARCAWCRGRVIDLSARSTPEEILSAVLRHAVQSHELPLSGAPYDEEDHHGRRGGPLEGEGPRDPLGDPAGDEHRADAVRRDAEAPAGRRPDGGA